MERMIEGGPLQVFSYVERGEGVLGNKIPEIPCELKSRIEITSSLNC